MNVADAAPISRASQRDNESTTRQDSPTLPEGFEKAIKIEAQRKDKYLVLFPDKSRHDNCSQELIIC